MEKIQALAFFDLDGTLLNAKSQVDPEVASAIIELRKNHVMPIIATGRTNFELNEIMKITGINSVISMNGQYVQFDGKEVYSSKIPIDTCSEVLKVTQEQGHELGFYNHETIAVTGVNPTVEACYSHIHGDIPPIDPEIYQRIPINMLLILSEEGDAVYHEAFPELTFFRNGPYSIDTIAPNGSKGNGVRELVKALSLETIPTYAFGDGLNDIDLFNACKYRIAMGNARQQLKDISTYITDTNTEGGIIKGLRHYNLV